MDSAQIIEIVKATAGSIDSLISQTALFFAIGAAAKWLSISLPLLIIFSVMIKLAKTFTNDTHKGVMVLAAWICFGLTLFTGVRGISHIAQAAVAPSIYVASEFGEIGELLKSLKK